MYSEIKVELQAEGKAVAAAEVRDMDPEDVVSVELDIVLYGEGDVSVDVYLGFEGRVGVGWGRMLPEYGCVE